MAMPLELAQQILLDTVQTAETEKISLECCWRRILAEDVTSSTDYPPFDRTPLDGYALIAAEVAAASPDRPVRLRQIDSIPAGGRTGKMIAGGTACRIMTGAPVPAGATGIVRLEDVAVAGTSLQVYNGKDAAKNICRRGEEIVKGEQVLSAGTVINAGAMGMLALLGIARPLVFKRPKVGLLATGDEVIPVDVSLTPGKIRDSNSYMLAAQAREAGAEPVLLGQSGDDVEEICRNIAKAEECDLLVTTGGASVGDYDLMGRVFARLGAKVLFERVSMKPGMPVLAGCKDGRLYLGLSGNPAAASLSFEQLVRPVLLKMAGRKELWRPRLRARLTGSIDKGPGPLRFVWARYWPDGERIAVKPLPLQGNGMLKSAIPANALVVVPENSQPLAAGAEVEIIDLSIE